MPALRLNGVFSNIITQTTNSCFSHFVICKLVCVLLAPQYQIGLNKIISLVERIAYGDETHMASHLSHPRDP